MGTSVFCRFTGTASTPAPWRRIQGPGHSSLPASWRISRVSGTGQWLERQHAQALGDRGWAGWSCGGQAPGRRRRRRCGSSRRPAWLRSRANADACRVGAARHLHRAHTRADDDRHALAGSPCRHLRELPARDAEVIRIDAVWLAVEPVDMRAGADRLLASVVQVFGAAQAHHGYLFANARSTRIKLLVHDGFGVWCAARRLNKGSFEWPRGATPDATAGTTAGPTAGTAPLTLTVDQFNALVLGLPWQRLEQLRCITRL